MVERIGVYVLGMHRSGTSALARVIDLLGVPVADDGLLAPSEDNPAGYWEPLDLVLFNQVLLRELGGRTMAPPPLAVSAHAAHFSASRYPQRATCSGRCIPATNGHGRIRATA